MSKEKVGTMDFAKAVVDRLGQTPERFPTMKYNAREDSEPIRAIMREQTEKRELVGMDLFVHWRDKPIDELGEALRGCSTEKLELKMISCKGLKVWPDTEHNMDVTDRYRCRFRPQDAKATITHEDIAELLGCVASKGIDFLKIENLFTFDGEPGFVKSAGE